MIHKSTFEFLTDIAENNNREWFLENKKRHDLAKINVLEFTIELLDLMKAFDVSLINTTAASCQSRIYRDIRFSKNKTPYKTNIGIIIGPQGKKGTGACYYLHIQPGASFAAGGYWMPEAEDLKKIRQEIDYNSADFKSILEKKSFRETYGELSAEDKLKTSPKGFDAQHPEIELLKLKSFTVSHPFKDSFLMNKSAAEKISEIWKELYPLNNFLQEAVR